VKLGTDTYRKCHTQDCCIRTTTFHNILFENLLMYKNNNKM